MEPQLSQIEIASTRDILKTEQAIGFIKERFRKRLEHNLNLVSVSAPIAIPDETGLNDDLNGVEKPVSFEPKSISGKRVSVVQSLAKWKRFRLKEFNIEPGRGILTDMRAIRPDEDLSPLHSVYVDQWDWEKRITSLQRSIYFLKSTVESIYDVIRSTERDLCHFYPEMSPVLPDHIHFIHAEELLRMYPGLTPKQRESKIAERYGAVFIIGIGACLSNGQMHDGRAPDYDDWSTVNEEGYAGLNGDIILWYEELKSALEVSSMGIRVNRESLIRQLEIRGCNHLKHFPFHSMLLNDELPSCIGGGIGQSRICMFLLKKRHIGEVQSSVWPDSVLKQAEIEGFALL